MRRAVLALALSWVVYPNTAAATEERRGLLLRMSAGPGPLYLASSANWIADFEQTTPSRASAWGATATGEIGGSIGTGWVLSGYARYGAYTGVRGKVHGLTVQMQNLALVTIGTGASLTHFPNPAAGSYVRMQLGFLGLGFEAYANGQRRLLEDLRGPECSLAYGYETHLTGNLWAGVSVDLAAARLSDDDPGSGTALFTPSVRASLTFF